MSSDTLSANDSTSGFVRGLGIAITVSSILFWGIVLWWAFTQTISRVQYGVIFIGGILTVYALDQSRQAIRDGDRIDVAVLLPAAIVLISAAFYFATNFQEVYVQRQGYALEHEYILARLVILSLLYLTWREFGNLFLGLVAGGILYGYFGDLFPGILNHGGLSQNHLLQMLVTDLYGFYGSLTQLTAAWIAPFLLYAGLLFGYGAFQLILRIAVQSAKFIESGVAQTAVLASAVIGSINGSYTANAAMTGSFTIPTMKDSGMAPHRAAAIESVASTSGQVLPPVMGASAFVMASYLSVPYVDIIVAGLVPAAILVVCIAIAVHYVALGDTSDQSMEFSEFFDVELTRRDKLFAGVRFGLPFLVLIYLLGIRQWTVMTSALWTIVAMVVLGVGVPVARSLYESVAVYDSWLLEARDDARTIADDSRRSTSGLSGRVVRRTRTAVRTVRRIRPVAEFVDQIGDTVHGFRRGALILAPIAIILSAVNGVVDVFSVTGVPNKIALLLIELSGGVLLYAVVLAMAVSILMGVGMPTVAAYVIVAILIAPTLVSDFGIPDIAAHYTVFYAAILAGITPPVATAAVVAAGIAEANFWRTCGAAIKIAAPLFVLPVAFVYNTDLVSMSTGPPTLIAGLLVLMGGIAMIYGINYPFEISPGRRLGLRLGLTALGVFVMVYPGRAAKLAGILIFAVVFVAEKVFARGWDVSLGGRVIR